MSYLTLRNLTHPHTTWLPAPSSNSHPQQFAISPLFFHAPFIYTTHTTSLTPALRHVFFCLINRGIMLRSNAHRYSNVVLPLSHMHILFSAFSTLHSLPLDVIVPSSDFLLFIGRSIYRSPIAHHEALSQSIQTLNLHLHSEHPFRPSHCSTHLNIWWSLSKDISHIVYVTRARFDRSCAARLRVARLAAANPPPT